MLLQSGLIANVKLHFFRILSHYPATLIYPLSSLQNQILSSYPERALAPNQNEEWGNFS